MEKGESSSPFLFTKYIYQWLEQSLDYGIKEHEFWDMTLAEIMRAIESQKRVKKIEAQEKAVFDYLLADLIYRSMARIYDNNVSYPAIEEAYPAFFDAKAIEKKKQEKKDEL